MHAVSSANGPVQCRRGCRIWTTIPACLKNQALGPCTPRAAPRLHSYARSTSNPPKKSRKCASPAVWRPRCSTISPRIVKPGMTTAEIDRLCHDYMRERAGRDPGAAQLRAAGLPALPEVDLHLGQSRRVPRRSRREEAEARRHRQRRHHGHQGRLPRRHEPHVLRRPALDPGAAPVRESRTNACGAGSRRCARAPTWATSATPFRPTPSSNGFSVVREFCGHGIGRRFHEEPQVLHYGRPGTGLKLEAGMIFTVEPMINAGKADIRQLADGWTIVTKDHSLSAQWEHTVLVTETGYEVLTLSAGTPPAVSAAPLMSTAAAVAHDAAAIASRLAEWKQALARERERLRVRVHGASRARGARCGVCARSSIANLREIWKSGAMPRNRRARRGRRLRPRRALSLFRRRSPDSAARRLPIRRSSGRARAADRPLLGHRAGSRSQRAHRRRMRGGWPSRTSRSRRHFSKRACSREAARSSAVSRRRPRACSTRAHSSKRSSSSSSSATRATRKRTSSPTSRKAPGGLRDLHTILWIARAAGIGKSWADLAERELITTEEAREIQRARALPAARCAYGCTTSRAGAKTVCSSITSRRSPRSSACATSRTGSRASSSCSATTAPPKPYRS